MIQVQVKSARKKEPPMLGNPDEGDTTFWPHVYDELMLRSSQKRRLYGQGSDG